MANALGKRRSIQLSYGASSENDRRGPDFPGSPAQRRRNETAPPLPSPEFISRTEAAEKLTALSGRRRWSPRKGTLRERFDLLVERLGPDDCWPWKGFRDPDGYGRLTFNGVRSIGAHRVALEFAVGKLPPGAVVRHIVCDNPPCCNPAHLGAGSIADNNADMRAKGRQARGEQMPFAKLTEPEVIAIRCRYREGETAVSLAREYRVSDRLISFIAQGKKWAHIGGPRSAKRKSRSSALSVGGAQ